MTFLTVRSEGFGSVWRQYAAWPPPDAKPQTLYFHEAGRLAFEPPASSSAADSYVGDPAKPVPWVGYTAQTMPEEYMVSDQRFAATRPDVLVYVTEPLEEDLALAGPVSPKLFVSTTGTDSDWVVKLKTFVNIPTAKSEDFTAATQCVVRSQTQPSGVEVYVLRAP